MYEAKKAAKDYDGDGKIESGTDEYMGSRDKAIKKAMAKKGMKKEEIENVFAEIEEHHETDSEGNVIPHSMVGYKDAAGNIVPDEPPHKDCTPSSVEEGTSYGLYKGSGKASGAMKKYLDNAKKMQKADKKKKKTGNPAFDDPSHHSNAKNKYEGFVLQSLLDSLEEGAELDKYDAVVAYLIDEQLAEDFDHAQRIMVTLKPELIEEVYQNQLNEILEKGTKGKVGFRTGMQGGKQVMKTDKVTVMHKGTKASGGTKARKRPQSPEGKAIGALMKHKSAQWKAENKMKKASEKGDKKEADRQRKKAWSSYDKRRKQSGTLFDKTGDFHDRADND